METSVSYNLFTGRRASKDYKRSLKRQILDEVLEKCASKKLELVLPQGNLTTWRTTGSDQLHIVRSRTRMFSKPHLFIKASDCN